jgi:hypothetical protein
VVETKLHFRKQQHEKNSSRNQDAFDAETEARTGRPFSQHDSANNAVSCVPHRETNRKSKEELTHV